MAARYNYNTVVEGALEVWRENHEEYSSMLDQYHELIEKLKELHLPLYCIKRSDLNGFQKIEFLDLKTEEEAREYLYDLTPREIEALIGRINLAKQQYAYRRVREWIIDAKHRIKRKTMPKTFVYFLSNDATIRASMARCKRTSGNNDI